MVRGRCGGDNMTTTTRYAKPNMTNLPADLGKAIFSQILSTPKPDDDALEQETKKVERDMIKVRNRENAQGDTAK